MQAETIQKKASPKTIRTTVNGTEGKRISWEEFEKKYLAREDQYKYEWVDGMVEKTIRGINRTQLYMLDNLLDWFDQLKLEGKVTGRLMPEPDLFFLENYRRPDVAWFTKEQMRNLKDKKARDVPAFLIEVISGSNSMYLVKKKMINYRDAGVKVVWQIFPEAKQVDVYAGENLSQMVVKEGAEICSAAPALPGFEIPAVEIFK